MLWLLVCERRRSIILIRRVQLICKRLNTIYRQRFTRLVLRLKFVRFPRVGARRRIIVRIFDNRLLEIKLRAAKAAKVDIAGIKFSAILARIHIGQINILRSITNNSKQLFVIRQRIKTTC